MFRKVQFKSICLWKMSTTSKLISKLASVTKYRCNHIPIHLGKNWQHICRKLRNIKVKFYQIFEYFVMSQNQWILNAQVYSCSTLNVSRAVFDSEMNLDIPKASSLNKWSDAYVLVISFTSIKSWMCILSTVVGFFKNMNLLEIHKILLKDL